MPNFFTSSWSLPNTSPSPYQTLAHHYKHGNKYTKETTQHSTINEKYCFFWQKRLCPSERCCCKPWGPSVLRNFCWGDWNLWHYMKAAFIRPVTIWCSRSRRKFVSRTQSHKGVALHGRHKITQKSFSSYFVEAFVFPFSSYAYNKHSSRINKHLQINLLSFLHSNIFTMYVYSQKSSYCK